MAPRPKQERQVLHEQHLADQIRRERAQREWSLDNVAQRMTDAGCPMDRSAIYRIESGDPPRRITVDEAATFAAIFGRTLTDMLMPTPLARSREAAALFRRVSAIDGRIAALVQDRNRLVERILDVVDEGYRDEVQEALQQSPAADRFNLEAHLAYRHHPELFEADGADD